MVALTDGLAVTLADDWGNGVGSYPNDVQPASAATANAVNVAATGRWALICTPRCVGPDDQATLAKIATLWVPLVRPLSLPSTVTIFLARCCSGRALTLYCLTLRKEILLFSGWSGSSAKQMTSRLPCRHCEGSGVT